MQTKVAVYSGHTDKRGSDTSIPSFLRFRLLHYQYEGRLARLVLLMALNTVKSIIQAEQVLPLRLHSE